MSLPLLQVRQLNINFLTRQGCAPAVRQVDLELGRGEVLGLVGESGSGKSVTALAIMRLLPPQAQIFGQIDFAGRDLLCLNEKDLRALRGAESAMIFQEPMTSLNPVMRIGEQVAEAVMAHNGRGGERQGPDGRTRKAAGEGFTRVSQRDAWDRAIAALRDVQIPDAERRARDYPHQLSGGQRQRVMIAMAIVNRPKLLIADEPTTALDVTIQAQVLDLLAEIRQKYGLAMLLISHDLAVVSQVADRVAVMYAGSIVEMGAARQVLSSPTHPYTRGLLAAVPTLRTDRTSPLRTIEGIVPAIASLPPGCAFEPRCDWRVEDCSRALPPLVEVEPGHWARCPVSARFQPHRGAFTR